MTSNCASKRCNNQGMSPRDTFTRPPLHRRHSTGRRRRKPSAFISQKHSELAILAKLAVLLSLVCDCPPVFPSRCDRQRQGVNAPDISHQTVAAGSFSMRHSRRNGGQLPISGLQNSGSSGHRTLEFDSKTAEELREGSHRVPGTTTSAVCRPCSGGIVSDILTRWRIDPRGVEITAQSPADKPSFSAVSGWIVTNGSGTSDGPFRFAAARNDTWA